MMFIYWLLFIVCAIFSFYIPGKIFINFLKLSLRPFDSFIISWFIGISLFLFGTYLFSWIQLSQIYLFVLIALNVYALLKKRKILFKFEKLDYWSLFIVVLGSLSFLYVMYFSGFITNVGIQFIGVNGQDGIRHIAYIKSQVNIFPPQHPGMAGVDLKGFHYFYDFLLAKFSQFYLFSVEDLYFRFFPLLISVLYGFSFYFLSRKLTSSLNASRLILFFAYFAQSFSVILFLLNNKIDLSYSPIVHPIGLIINPFIVLAIGMLITGLALLPEIKKSFKYAIIVGIIFGVLSQIKVYAGIIAIGAIIIYSLYILLRFRKKYFFNYIVLLVTTALITAVTFLPNNFRQGGLVFYPLEFYRHYISSHGFESLNWDIRRVIFEQHNNYPRLIILYLEAIAIFWIYNLGISSITLLKIKSLFKKKFWLNDFNFIISLSIVIPILIASFFLQSVSAFDTVQFLWITIPLFGIPAGIVLAKLIKKNKRMGYVIIFLIIVFSLPGNVDFLLKYSPVNIQPVADKKQLNFFNNVNKAIPPKSFLIYIPKENLSNKNSFGGVPVISALSGIGVYLEGGNLPNKLDNVFKERLNNLVNLDKAISICDKKAIKQKLSEIGSRYILSENKYPCFKNNDNIEVISSNKYYLYIYN